MENTNMKKVLGMGNALVDILIRIDDDELLAKLGFSRGSMTLVEKGKMNDVLEATLNYEKQKSSGGSVANTIHGVSQLGAPCGYVGKIGKDEYGEFFTSYMKQININTELFSGTKDSGKCVVLISEDSERTFATYLGAAIELDAADLDIELFTGYDFFQLEGYLVQNHNLVKKSVELAQEAGNCISIDLASFNIVEENIEFLTSIVEHYVDIVFANEEEAKAFTGKSDPKEALNEISKKCQIAIVKIGKHGSLIKRGDEIHRIESIKANCIDTTGAGDLYAAGFFYGLANEYPLNVCGQIGSITSGKVVETIGSKMDEKTWEEIRKLVKNLKK
jgi:sugar/nucleoside kinase (ribokinase family)